MTTRPSWIETVTPNLKKDIEKIALAAYANACELFMDAKALIKENRLARAGALVILAEEEFSKSFILLVCAQQHRWDSVIFYALKDHSPKQGIAGAIREYFEWFVHNYNRVSQMSRISFIPITPSILPGKKQWDDLIVKTKKEIKKAKKDHSKQSLLYVGFDKAAKITSEPKNANKDQIENYFKEAERFKDVVEIALTGQIANFKKMEI